MIAHPNRFKEQAALAEKTAMGGAALNSHPRGLDELSRMILEREDLPACSQNIRAVLKLSASQNASVASFSAAALKDVTLSLRILQAANTALHNRCGRTILSVSHATALLGLDTVSQIAAGLKLLEDFARTRPGLRELITLSLLTASHARQIAAHCGFPRTEEAYLCGLLRNLGELLIAFYSPDDYARVLVLAESDRVDPGSASRRILGYEFEEVAARVMEGWGLSGPVVEAQSADPVDVLQDPAAEGGTLLLASSAAHALTVAVHRKPERESRAATRSVLSRFRPWLNLSEAELQPILHGAILEARDTFESLDISLSALKYQRQVERATALLEQRPIEPERLEQALAQLENSLTHDADLDVAEVVSTVLDAMVASGCCDRGLFAQCDLKRRLVQGRIARGGNLENHAQFFCYPLTAADQPVGHAVVHGEDVFLDVTQDSKVGDTPLAAVYRPVWLAILPVTVCGQPAACFYLDRTQPGFTLNLEERTALRRLRDIVARALSHKRASPKAAI